MVSFSIFLSIAFLGYFGLAGDSWQFVISKALTMAHILKEINVACLRAPEIVQNYAMVLMDLSSTLCLVRSSEMAVW